jgi:hypothetical protein
MKRSVLASWASDACAIGSNPALRATAGNVVNYDDIIDALQSLHAGQSADTVTYAFKRRQRRRRWSAWKGRGRRLQRVWLSRPWMGAQGSRAAFAAHRFLETINFLLAKSLPCITAIGPMAGRAIPRLFRSGSS